MQRKKKWTKERRGKGAGQLFYNCGVCLCIFSLVWIVYIASSVFSELPASEASEATPPDMQQEDIATLASAVIVVTAPSPPPPSTPTPKPQITTTSRRLVAIGDIHGDLRAFKDALLLGGVLCNPNTSNSASNSTSNSASVLPMWCGGDTTLVQLGDLVNQHKKEDREVLDFIYALERNAKQAGGEVFMILGDHDIGNWKALNDIGGIGGIGQLSAPPPWMKAILLHSHSLFVHGSLLSAALDMAHGSLEDMNTALTAYLATPTVPQPVPPLLPNTANPNPKQKHTNNKPKGNPKPSWY